MVLAREEYYHALFMHIFRRASKRSITRNKLPTCNYTHSDTEIVMKNLITSSILGKPQRRYIYQKTFLLTRCTPGKIDADDLVRLNIIGVGKAVTAD